MVQLYDDFCPAYHEISHLMLKWGESWKKSVLFPRHPSINTEQRFGLIEIVVPIWV